MHLTPGIVVAGRYRLEKQLAEGGMGSVWLARHAQLDVTLAVKFMAPTYTESAVARQRFELEAKAAANLKSAHVVQVHDYGVEYGTPYIVMELLEGEDLGRRLKREGRLGLPAAARIATQMARGLRRAHDAGLVHRDLKPPNIFLARNDDDEEIVKILDFGIAKDTASAAVGEATNTGELIGSPHFMSPEQIRGVRDIDHRSDLWSFGVILYRAVTGDLPFSGNVLGLVIAKILADPLPSPSQAFPELSPAVDAFFARAFSRDREGRFQSAREMAEAFSALAGEAPGVAGSYRGPFASVDFDAMPAPPEPMTIPTGRQLVDTKGRGIFEETATSIAYTPAPVDPRSPTGPTAVSSGAFPAPRSSSPLMVPAPTAGDLGATGGPVVHSQVTPPARLPPSRVWVGAAAAAMLAVGAGGIALYTLRGRPDAATPAPAAAPTASNLAPAASAAAVEPTAVAAGSAVPEVPAAATAAASATPSPSAQSSAQAPAASTGKPAVKPPTATPSLKKKPAWGF